MVQRQKHVSKCADTKNWNAQKALVGARVLFWCHETAKSVSSSVVNRLFMEHALGILSSFQSSVICFVECFTSCSQFCPRKQHKEIRHFIEHYLLQKSIKYQGWSAPIPSVYHAWMQFPIKTIHFIRQKNLSYSKISVIWIPKTWIPLFYLMLTSTNVETKECHVK